MTSDRRTVWRPRTLVRSGVAALSVLVVAVSAFAWVQLGALDRSTPSASVISTPVPALTEAQNILLVGVDARTDAAGNPLPPDLLASLNAGSSGDGGDTADSLMVVHVPAGGGRATAFSIPRDAYVQLADGFGKHKINSAYSRAVTETTETLTTPSTTGGGASSPMFAPESLPGVTPSPEDPGVRRAAAAAGARTTIGTVEALTGLRISHFASVNLVGFAEVSRAIGGVPVCLRAPVTDPGSGLVLPAGVQEVSGAQALAFVRQRYGLPGGDLARITRQQVFLAGATERLLSAGTLANPFALARLTGVLSRNVTLDAGWDVLGFARQMQGLTAGSVTFRTVPTGTSELSTPSDGLAVRVDPQQVQGFVAETLAADAGEVRPPAPAPPAAPPPPPAPATPAGLVMPFLPAPASPITAAAPGCID